MVSVIMFSVIAVVLAGAGAYAVLSTFEASMMITEGQETAARMDQVEAVLTSLLAAPNADGQAYLPQGVADNNRYFLLPSGYGMPRVTPFGDPILYCPFGQQVGTLSAGVAQQAGTTPYTAGVVSNGITGGIPYVTEFIDTSGGLFAQSDLDDLAAQGNLRGVIIAPDPNETPDLYSCYNVRRNANGRYYPTDGSGNRIGGEVRVITQQGLAAVQAIAAASEYSLFVDDNSPDDSGPCVTGPCGLNANFPATLSTALQRWDSVRPRQSRLEIDDDATLTVAAIDDGGGGFADSGEFGHVRILGDNGAPPTITLTNDGHVAGEQMGLALPADVFVRDVIFTAGAFGVERNRRAKLINVDFQGGLVALEGSRLVMEGVDVPSTGNATMRVQADARAYAEGGTYDDIIVETGATLQLVATTGNPVRVDGTLTAQPGSRVILNADGAAIDIDDINANDARLSLIGSTAAFSVTIGAAGAAPTISASRVTVEGFVDSGDSLSFNGGSLVIMNGSQWNFGAFRLEAEGSEINVLGDLIADDVDLDGGSLNVAAGASVLSSAAGAADALVWLQGGAVLSASSTATIGGAANVTTVAVNLVDDTARVYGAAGVFMRQVNACSVTYQPVANGTVVDPGDLASGAAYQQPDPAWTAYATAEALELNCTTASAECALDWVRLLSANTVDLLTTNQPYASRLNDWCAATGGNTP